MTKDELLAMPSDCYMNEAQLSFFSGVLADMSIDLAERRDAAMRHLRTIQTASDIADQADLVSEREATLRLAARLAQQSKNVVAAMERIASGEFGYCLGTGEEIGIARLLHAPESPYSVAEQERMERLRSLRAA